MTTRVLPAASGCGGKRRRNKTLDGGGVTGRNSAGSYVIERAVQGRAGGLRKEGREGGLYYWLLLRLDRLGRGVTLRFFVCVCVIKGLKKHTIIAVNLISSPSL